MLYKRKDRAVTHPLHYAPIPVVDPIVMLDVVGPDAEPADAPPPTELWKTHVKTGRTRKGKVDGKVFVEDGYRYAYVIWEDLKHRGPVKQRLDICGDYVIGLK